MTKVPYRWRDDYLAARGGRAAAGDARDRISSRYFARIECARAAVRIGLLVNPENANVESVTREIT